MPDRALLQELLWCRDEGETAPVPIREPAKSPTAGICGGRRDKRILGGAAPAQQAGAETGQVLVAQGDVFFSVIRMPGGHHTPRLPRQHPLLRRAARRRRGEPPLSKRGERYRISRRASWADPLGEMVTQSASETLSLREIIGNKTERLNWWCSFWSSFESQLKVTAVRSISEQIQLVSYLRSNAFGGVAGKCLINGSFSKSVTERTWSNV